MKSVPSNSTLLAYWEINTLGTDEALEGIYDSFKYSNEMHQLGDIGVKRSHIEQSSRVLGFGKETVTIFIGKMDIGAIKSELDKREYYEREDYELEHNQGASIWTPDNTKPYKSIAVIGDIVLMGDRGDIIECVDVIALDQKRSLNDDDDMNLLIDRLPDGVLVYLNKADSDPEEDYTDLIVYGKSYAKQGDEELKLTAIYMFEDYFAAKDAEDTIKNYLSNNGFTDTKVESFDEIYLRVTAVINTADFVNDLDW